MEEFFLFTSPPTPLQLERGAQLPGFIRVRQAERFVWISCFSMKDSPFFNIWRKWLGHFRKLILESLQSDASIITKAFINLLPKS